MGGPAWVAIFAIGGKAAVQFLPLSLGQGRRLVFSKAVPELFGEIDSLVGGKMAKIEECQSMLRIVPPAPRGESSSQASGPVRRHADERPCVRFLSNSAKVPIWLTSDGLDLSAIP